MLKDLVNIANRLDSIGLTKEADYLDRLIKKEIIKLSNSNDLNKSSFLDNRIWYHTTNKERINSILKNGLKVNSLANYSMASLDYMKDIYGVIPVFVAKSPNPYDNDSDSIVLSVDVSGLDLVSDIPTLASHYGAYIDEDGIWFEEGDSRVPSWSAGEDIVFYDDLLNAKSSYCQDSIQTTGTAAIMSDISPDRIKVL
jgi:hypothetical protein